MEYLKVRWNHQVPTEPVLLFSELDGDRYEVRKVEIFADGQMGFASEGESRHGAMLGEKPIPPPKEIAADPQFVIEPTNAAEFESAWLAAKSGKTWAS